MSNVAINQIFYANTNKSELTERTIIRTTPGDNITVIDVSELSPDRQKYMAELYQKYQDYKTQFLKSIPSFETWAEQEENVYMSVPWKTLKTNHIIQK